MFVGLLHLKSSDFYYVCCLLHLWEVTFIFVGVTGMINSLYRVLP